jgi:GNAT superfamily N-acetyltransferase
LRHQGLGKELLKHTLKYCLENKIVLINTANSYGDMKQSDLIKFYEDNGMVLIHAGGLLIYPSP